MSSREMLNVAHATLVEEFQRPMVAQGMTIPGLSLIDALKAAQPWAEGYDGSEDEEQEQQEKQLEEEDLPRLSVKPKPKLSEEEIAAQNERALAAVQSKMGSVGGFFRG